jgi:MYXO-CTERM domain-containing protein
MMFDSFNRFSPPAPALISTAEGHPPADDFVLPEPAPGTGPAPTPARRWSAWAAALALGAICLHSEQAGALPGVIAGKGDVARVSNTTQVVLMKKGEQTAVTIWTDYEGPLDRFALVLPLPADVAVEEVKSIKRDAVDHLDEITAPRFHEFWEMDACEPGEAEQEWERDLKVKSGSADSFLGAAMPDVSGGQKLPPEMLLDFEPQFKEGEYTFSMVPKGQTARSYLTKKGLSLPAGGAEALARYEERGQQVLVAEVTTSKVELAGARRALLSPIRFATREDYAIPETLGLANSAGHQELVVYVLHPEKRFEAQNYANVFPPTNVAVDFAVKERLGEFYAGVHDALLAKNPKAFLIEYAWPAEKPCGEPCPNAPLAIHELLSMGVDSLEADVPEADRKPKPPEPTEEEKAQLAAVDKPTRKRLMEQRSEVARRRALLDRNNFVITRLHHRFSKDSLTEDIKVQPAEHVQGGVGTPVGPNAELPGSVEPSKQSRLQTRYSVSHPSKRVVQCDDPKRWRWGKAPPSYRGLRKTWTARDLAYKKRDKFALKDVIKSSVPALGISVAAAAEAAPEAAPAEAKQESGCSVTQGRAPQPLLAVLGAALIALSRRRRR